MKKTIPLFFAAFAALTQAAPMQQEPVRLASFDARVQLADGVEADERFKTYRPAMFRRAGKQLARTMRTCIAVSPKTDKKSVVLVADISAEGRAMAVEVKPDNAVAKCFAAGFSSISFPKPPAYPDRQGFPVVMRIGVRQ